MACDDRQLTQTQRAAGFEQLRNAGVLQAVRPFSGSASLPNLIDYVNRELFPAVKQTRSKVNDVYRPVTDNAPSANPLAYYFSTETGAADPTVGRLRLNDATQEDATVVRVSQTNGRLKDVGAWLDMMAGSATEPLGGVTLFHATDPGRFIRFDLETMLDNGAYWDLGVTFVESSHDSPFLESDSVVLAFIPGVASSGATVPVGALSPIPADTFIGNTTASTAPPVAVPLADIDSTSIVYDTASHTFQRAALTGGDISSTQNSNALTIDNNAVTNPKLRDSAALSVIGRSANTSGDPADIAAANDGEVLRRSGTTVGFGTITGSGIAAGTVANANLADMAQSRIKGRAEGAGTGAPTDLTPTQVMAIVDAENVAWTGNHSFTSSTFAVTTTSTIDIHATTDLIVNGVAGTVIASAAVAPAAVTAGTVHVDADGRFRVTTNGVERLEIEDDGAWQVAGTVGTAGHPLVTAGGSAPPAWGQLGSAGIADEAVTLAKQADLAQSRIVGRAEGAGTGVPTALTPTQVVSIIDGETVTWAGVHTFNDNIVSNATTVIAGRTAMTGVTTTASTSVSDLDIGVSSAVRFTGANVGLFGMIPFSTNQLVLLVNATSSTTGTTLQIFTENGTEGTASRRFAGPVTSIDIERGRAAWAWYDNSSSRWRVVAGPNAV